MELSGSGGPRVLFLTGTVGAGKTTTAYAIGDLLRRLRPQLDRVEARLTARHQPGDERDWHLRRAPQLEKMLDDASTADVTIDVGDETPAQVATQVLAASGWVG